MDNLTQIASLREAVYLLIQEVVSPLKWAELEQIIAKRYLNQSKAGVFTDTLPILTCMALGGNGESAIPLAATWVLYLITGRIFDDIQDKGAPLSSMNLGLGALACAQIPLSYIHRFSEPSLVTTLVKQCNYAFAAGSYSQAKQWAYSVPSEEAYFENIFGKSGNFFGTAAWSGGYVSSPNPPELHLNALYNYGFAAGIMFQIEDDCRDLSEDIDRGFFTLPVIYAITNKNHPAYDTLTSLLSKGKLPVAERKIVIDMMHSCNAINMAFHTAKLYMVQAQKSLDDLPDNEAKRVLIEYVT